LTSKTSSCAERQTMVIAMDSSCSDRRCLDSKKPNPAWRYRSIGATRCRLPACLVAVNMHTAAAAACCKTANPTSSIKQKSRHFLSRPSWPTHCYGSRIAVFYV
jgi:hypothetical protein